MVNLRDIISKKNLDFKTDRERAEEELAFREMFIPAVGITILVFATAYATMQLAGLKAKKIVPTDSQQTNIERKVRNIYPKFIYNGDAYITSGQHQY